MNALIAHTKYGSFDLNVVVANLIQALGMGVYRRLRMNKGKHQGGSTLRQFSFMQSRLVIEHILIPLLDIAGFKQTKGPRFRYYTDPVESEYAVNPSDLGYTFETYDYDVLTTLFHVNDTALLRNFTRRVHFYPRCAPEGLTQAALEEVATELLGDDLRLDATGKLHVRPILEVLLHEEYFELEDNDAISDVVEGMVSVKLAESGEGGVMISRPFIISACPDGDSHMISCSFHMTGLKRNTRKGTDLLPLWPGLQ